jgi:hypothetical protein
VSVLIMFVCCVVGFIRHFVPSKVPGLVGPDFPFPPSVAKFFRKLLRRKDAPASR